MKQKFNFNHEIALPQCVACPIVYKIFLSVRGLIYQLFDIRAKSLVC